ncbi:MAG: alpha/beta hydrolase [Candidatus Nomurabacteria bacterium]|jgi:pimeloyl-ACP methyl ester carboxylesterase|nr:alpha/beta hydrolase [Candidatus Nomurabacteria bacterium]
MTHIIFIAGAGQDKAAWQAVSSKLPDTFTVHTFAVTDLAEPFSIQTSAETLYKYMSESSIKRAVFCGLSLGSMISTEFAIRYPEQVESLILCGSQVHPNKLLMALQSGIMKLLPEKTLGLPPKLTKRSYSQRHIAHNTTCRISH